MKKITLNTAFVVSLLTLGGVLASCGNTPKEAPLETKKGSSYAVSDANGCNCATDWFPHDSTQNPLEGANSLFAATTTNDSIFHQWSWQKFLWLTKPKNGKPLFESFQLVNSQLINVNPHISGGTTTSLVLESSQQAGSNQVLMTNPKFSTNNTSDTVFYAIYVNDSLQQTAIHYKDSLMADTAKITNNDYAFPIGALEVKTAWVVVDAIGSDSTYYTTQAYIPSRKSVETVALLGMHVTGVVINHPEFIWATFEHDGMAPVYSWENTTSTATEDVLVTAPNEELLFETTNIQQNYFITNPRLPKSFTVFEYGIPRTANNAIMPGLAQDSAGNANNLANILSLNTCAKSSLLAAGDIFGNYSYHGSVWLDTDSLTPSEQITMMKNEGYNVGSAAAGSHARGSLAAFNITMETFVQTSASIPVHEMGVNEVTNCMGCHTTKASVLYQGVKHKSLSALNFSHLFRSYMGVSGGATIEEVKRLRLQEFQRELVLRSVGTN